MKQKVKKRKPNEEIEFTAVYFNSSTKTIINNRFKLEHAFQKIIYRMLGLIKDLVGLLNQLSQNTLIFQLIGH